MKYNESHVRDFEGAKGVCEVCGLEITLDWKDSPIKPLDNIWLVNCPHCKSPVRCCQPVVAHADGVRDAKKQEYL